MRPTKKLIYGVIMIAIIAIAAVSVYYFTRPQEPQELTKITYLLGWKHTLQNYAGFYVAMYKGYYADVGIELEMVEGMGTLYGAQQLAAEKVDFAEVSGIVLLTAIAQGMNLTMIAPGYQGSAIAFFTLDPAIQTPKDWEGKNVGITPASGSYIEYRAVCEFAGVDRSTITEINTDYNMVVTLATGNIDVATGCFVTDAVSLEDMGYPNGTKSWYIRSADYGITTYGAGITVRSDFLEDPENKDLARRFVEATSKGFYYAFTHIGEALDIFKHYNPDFDSDKEYRLAAISIPMVQNVTTIWEDGWGWMTSSVWEQTEDMLYTYELIGQHVTVTEGSCWTNEFISPP